MTQASEGKVNKSFWVKLVLVPIGFFMFAFALVPLYNVICDITGLNGNTTNLSSGSTTENVAEYYIDENRQVSIDFTSITAPGLPINFTPKVKKMDVVPGKIYTMEYIAENRSDNTIVAQAVPSVAPGLASIHFKKLECFCFDKQTFEPKKPITMPVRFVVEPQLDKHIYDITLSYNVFKIEEPVATVKRDNQEEKL